MQRWEKSLNVYHREESQQIRISIIYTDLCCVENNVTLERIRLSCRDGFSSAISRGKMDIELVLGLRMGHWLVRLAGKEADKGHVDHTVHIDANIRLF